MQDYLKVAISPTSCTLRIWYALVSYEILFRQTSSPVSLVPVDESPVAVVQYPNAFVDVVRQVQAVYLFPCLIHIADEISICLCDIFVSRIKRVQVFPRLIFKHKEFDRNRSTSIGVLCRLSAVHCDFSRSTSSEALFERTLNCPIGID